MAHIELESVTKLFAGDVARGRRHRPDDRGRRVHGARRPVGLREVDALADDRRARGADGRHDLDRRPRRHRPCAAPPRRRNGLPELRALPAHERPPEPRLRAQGAAHAEAGDRAACRSRWRSCSASRSSSTGSRRHLSGGQRQRVAMGRAIVREPQAFLMDEPLSNLDAKLRVGMRASLSQLHARLGVTTVYVTHDQVEAMTLGHRVAVMRDGKILQVDAPQTLYREPRDLFVAAFIGSPAMNLVEAVIEGDDVCFRPVSRPPRATPPASCGNDATSCSASAPSASRTQPTQPTARRRSKRTSRCSKRSAPTATPTSRVDAPRITAESLEADDDATLLAEQHVAVQRPRRSARAARIGDTIRLAVDAVALPLLRSRDGREPDATDLHDRDARVARARSERRMTKQAETREQVLDLIEQLSIGDAIPSERALSTDLGVSRLTVRAALDELVREGYLVRRRGAGTFVSEPKIAQELTMTSFTEDMRQRGMSPASRTLELRTVPAGARLGRILHVSPSEPVVVATRLRLADRETMAIEALHVRQSLVPDLSARDLEEHSFYELLQERYGIEIVTGLQTVEPTVTGEEESAALGVPLHSPAFVFERVTRSESRRDRRVRPVGLSRRPVSSRHGAPARRAGARIAHRPRRTKRRLESHTTMTSAVLDSQSGYVQISCAVASGLNQLAASPDAFDATKERRWLGRPSSLWGIGYESTHRCRPRARRGTWHLCHVRGRRHTAIGSQHHRLAAERRTERLAGPRRVRQSAVPQAASRRRRQRPVPDVADAPAEVRRDARRRQRARRHRDGHHGDDEVHGRGCVPGPHGREGRPSTTPPTGSRP